MTAKDYFQIPQESRNQFIDELILGKLPKDKRDSVKEKVEKIVNNYVGQDMHALSILQYAVEKGKLDEFIEKLEAHYKDSLQYVHPEARTLAKVPGAARAELFFLECYKSLGIAPNSD